MKIKIANFRGISDADIDLAPITLIAGQNGAGKTSILQAVSAAITGNTVPIDGLKTNHASRLLRSGSKGGEVSFITDSGTSTVTYPDGKMSSLGDVYFISDFAAGIKSILDVPTKERAAIITAILGAEPTRDDLVAELSKLASPIMASNLAIFTDIDKLVASIWQNIEATGWDGAHAHAKEKGAKLKGSWEQITGEQYGSKKAESWLPAGWDSSLWNAQEKALQDTVKTETEWVTAATASRAVEQAEVTRLQSLVADGKAAAQELALEKNTHDTLLKSREDISETIRNIPLVDESTHVCPACSAPLSISCGKIVHRIVPTAEQLAARTNELEQAKYSEKICLGAIEASAIKMRDLSSRVRAGVAAQQSLDQISTAPAAQSHGSVDDCRARLGRAQDLLRAFQLQKQAAAVQENIIRNQILVDMLAPTGIRKSKTAAKLSVFNEALAKLSTVAGWSGVEVSDDLSVSFGPTPYALASESEQFRCRVTLQAAICLIQQSELLIIDRADVLDSTGRNGLVRMLRSMQVPALVAMTISKRADVPNMAALGGAGYWVERGTVSRA